MRCTEYSAGHSLEKVGGICTHVSYLVGLGITGLTGRLSEAQNLGVGGAVGFDPREWMTALTGLAESVDQILVKD